MANGICPFDIERAALGAHSMVMKISMPNEIGLFDFVLASTFHFLRILMDHGKAEGVERRLN
jgi:hypothetical protein